MRGWSGSPRRERMWGAERAGRSGSGGRRAGGGGARHGGPARGARGAGGRHGRAPVDRRARRPRGAAAVVLPALVGTAGVRHALAVPGRAERHCLVRGHAAGVPGDDGTGARPPAAGLGGSYGRHHPGCGLGALRLVGPRRRAATRHDRRRGRRPGTGQGCGRRGNGTRRGAPGMGQYGGHATAPGPAGRDHAPPVGPRARRHPRGRRDRHSLRAHRPVPVVGAGRGRRQRPGTRRGLPRG